jgi:hypothetical protein
LADIKMSTTKPGTGEIMQDDPLISYGAALRAIVDHSVRQTSVFRENVRSAFEDRSGEVVEDSNDLTDLLHCEKCTIDKLSSRARSDQRRACAQRVPRLTVVRGDRHACFASREGLLLQRVDPAAVPVRDAEMQTGVRVSAPLVCSARPGDGCLQLRV